MPDFLNRQKIKDKDQRNGLTLLANAFALLIVDTLEDDEEIDLNLSEEEEDED